ncbi:hypothetical protein LEP1GSC137_2669 [Leptospira borgpetersenii str. Noumea 25]|nr:hypothetical protein LEP1GSC121_1985 [Leptospira borgpetersenii serovar Castellonis str. 200801910]EMO09212.1 hypothetical protein LEP1GSC137_2669 [Leptospira borgpetersenii str. Noumea 25]
MKVKKSPKRTILFIGESGLTQIPTVFHTWAPQYKRLFLHT